MITIKDILIDDEIQKYNKEWKDFKDKYKHNTSYNVHSGNPVISRIYKFEDKPLFRAHVFCRRLRKEDPYNMAKKCLQPFWHAKHYLTVAEQMYTASTRLIIGDNYNQLMAKEVPGQFRWKNPIFWRDNISIELIRVELGKRGKYDVQQGYFTFYSEKADKVLSRMSAASYWQKRAYVKDIQDIKQYNGKGIESLIRKIKWQDINHKRILKPRNNLLTTKDDLIKELRKGNIPEKELDDFFSFW